MSNLVSNSVGRIIVKPLNGEASIVDNEFAVIPVSTAEAPVDIPSEGKVLVHLSVWEAHKPELTPRAQCGDLGVYLNPEDNPELLQGDVNVLKLIAFHFPVFKFGQGYSGAYLLRTRYGFKGDIRAFGDIWRDQFFFLARCGFTQFSIKEGKSLEDALNAFADFTIPYQTSADGSLPVFNRRAAAAGA
ncbi:MAG TPA: DUF934 domain-containing protein [Limnobacter sp.]|nr:DUF934 domain-containing protein [Limnobacter sp.]